MQTLRSKIAFFGLFISLLTGAILSAYTIHKNTEFFKRSSAKDAEFKLNSIIQTIKNNSKKIESDVLFLAATPPIQGILRASQNNGIDPKDGSSIETWKLRLQKIFEEMMYLNTDYMQIRYIGVEGNGKEIVRTERFFNKVKSLKDENLQSKGENDYFKNTLKNYPYKVYFSKITPNKEFGKVIYPIQMILRAGVPIFESNQKPFAGVFINANYSSLFKGLNYFHDNSHLLLVKDETGRPLISYKNGFKSYQDDKNTTINHEDLFEGLSEDDRPTILTKKIYYNKLNPNQFLEISFSHAQNRFQRDIYEFYLSEAIIILILLLITVLISYFISRRFVAPLGELHTLTKSIKSGEFKSHELDYVEGSDELSLLKNTLIDMFKSVESSSKQVDDQKKALDSSAIVAETDEFGRITYVNEKFIELSGYSRGELLGQDHRILNSGHHSKEFFKDLWQTINKGLVWKGEVKNRRKDGEFYWVDTTIYPVRDIHQKIEKFIAIRLDITEQKRVQEEYLSALRTKANFLANMSHEIRTPLNGIIGFTDILLSKELDKENMEDVEHIKNCSEGLLQIINDILDSSKIESGNFEFSLNNFEFSDCIESSLSVLETNLRTKNINFNLNLDKKIDQFLISDDMRLRQVILNILGNAIKFTPDNGNIEFDVLLEEDNSHFQTVLFSVRDNGVGIAKENQAILFESFKQADSSISKKFGGTGLGLSISKKIVEGLNGRIWLESCEGEGTTVFFTIKFAKVSVKDNEKLVIVNDKKDAQNLIVLNPQHSMDVLIAEDNLTNQVLIKKMLMKIGHFDITFVENGQAAIDIIKEQNFPIVFMDVQMPVMDGLTATKTIRNELKYSGVIVGLSANAFEEDFNKGYLAGMDYYLSKPVNSKKLQELMLKLKEEKNFVQLEQQAS